MKNKIISAAIFILGFAVFVSGQNNSVYTSLETGKCKTIESNPDEGGSYLGECPGISGYKLQVLEGDLRQSLNVITPNGKKYELNIWHALGGFSSVGAKAEWRMKKSTPVGLIVRFNVSENPDDSTKISSYLIVAKISKTSACITNVVQPGKTQNLQARKFADAALTRPGKSFG